MKIKSKFENNGPPSHPTYLMLYVLRLVFIFSIQVTQGTRRDEDTVIVVTFLYFSLSIMVVSVV